METSTSAPETTSLVCRLPKEGQWKREWKKGKTDQKMIATTLSLPYLIKIREASRTRKKSQDNLTKRN